MSSTKNVFDTLDIKNRLFLAPLAGVTDSAFRILAFELGCGLAFTEMVSAKALFYGDHKTKDLMMVDPREGTVGIQIFGHEEDVLKNAVHQINDLERFAVIDINMGCPAKKVVKNGDGSALMKDLEQARRVIRVVVQESEVPVSVKFRLGWDEDQINFLALGRICEEEGVSFVTLHPRTTQQMYRGKAKREALFQLKKELSIPVVGNGDVMAVTDIEEMNALDAVSLARGAIHNPFLFRYAKGESTQATKKDLCDLMLHHYRLKLEQKEERLAMVQMRKHIQWYLKGIPHSCGLKNAINQSLDIKEVFSLIEEFGESYD